jgi:predicted ATP-dependent endonuclease of OLD family
MSPEPRHSRELLGFENLRVRSNIQSKELLENSSEVIYGLEENHLPEHLNGLGFMNMLYLMLFIEIKKAYFNEEKRNINLLFIEEPEAHTHPQMQYIFANKIKNILMGVENLQTIVTTHSSHIVSQCDFEDIRYLSRNDTDDNIVIKNFYSELSASYEGGKDGEDFKFLTQYLTLQSAELFFACKLIFIEGISERIIFPYFMKQYDTVNTKSDSIKLSSQNISILEVGSNAKVFLPFLKFLNIRTLIITDIDTVLTVQDADGHVTKNACAVSRGEDTSNYTLKEILKAPSTAPELAEWFEKLKAHSLGAEDSVIKVAYQSTENGYHGRSFEDAFVNVNLKMIKAQKDRLWGLKNRSRLETEADIYKLTEAIIDKKTDFASSLLYIALADEAVSWTTPEYIDNGLRWLAQ